MQLYISLKKAAAGPAREPSARSGARNRARRRVRRRRRHPPAYKPAFELGQRYRSFLREVNLRVVEPNTRSQALADFLAVLQAQPGPVSLSTVADLLKDRYDAENALTQKIAVLDVARLLVVSEALTFAGGQPSSLAPIRQAADLTVEELARACDTAYVWRLVEGGVPVYADQLAPVLHGPDADPAAVAALCDGLVDRGMIVATDDTFAVAPQMIEALLARPELRLAAAGLSHGSAAGRQTGHADDRGGALPRGLGFAPEGLRRQRAALLTGGARSSLMRCGVTSRGPGWTT